MLATETHEGEVAFRTEGGDVHGGVGCEEGAGTAPADDDVVPIQARIPPKMDEHGLHVRYDVVEGAGDEESIVGRYEDGVAFERRMQEPVRQLSLRVVGQGSAMEEDDGRLRRS
jgi:hypothetical protein